MAETLDSVISLALGNVPDIKEGTPEELYEALLAIHQAIEILVDYYDLVGGAYVTIGNPQTIIGAKTFSALATFNGGVAGDFRRGGDYIKLSDVKATTVSGGASVAGTQTRDLNTEDSDTGSNCDLAYTLAYDAQSANFTVGQIVTDGTSGATGTIVADEDAGATGTLWIINITGTFGNNNTITDPLGGSATANIPSGVEGKGFYLAAGTYQIKASSPCYFVDRHKTNLYNISDVANELIGSSEYSDSTAGAVQSRSVVAGEFTISSSKAFKINHYTETVRAVSGLGVATSDGSSEVYTIVELWKVK